jgi:hypothetical protein
LEDYEVVELEEDMRLEKEHEAAARREAAKAKEA